MRVQRIPLLITNTANDHFSKILEELNKEYIKEFVVFTS